MSQDLTRYDIRDALLTWCFEERIEDVREIEMYFMSQELATFGYPNLGGASNRGAPTLMGDHSFESLRTNLDEAWKGILLDFRERVQNQEVHLLGVQTKPELHLHESPIPGQWAAEFRFDPLAGTIEVGPYRYVNVVVFPGPPNPLGPSIGPAPTTAIPVLTLRAEDVASLDDETILALLQVHAERVIQSPDAKLIAPGKISLMPIVKGKMQQRFDAGEMSATLKDESTAFAAWIESKAGLHQTPSAATIAKVLRGEYARLKARSKAAI